MPDQYQEAIGQIHALRLLRLLNVFIGFVIYELYVKVRRCGKIFLCALLCLSIILDFIIA